tara:strand:- start:386 stop:526 length:141 start_codon:yes stop_codon:yes gene_type:complete
MGYEKRKEMGQKPDPKEAMSKMVPSKKMMDTKKTVVAKKTTYKKKM